MEEYITPSSIGLFLFNKIGFFVGKLWKNGNSAAIFLSWKSSEKGNDLSYILSPTQAVQRDNPIVKK